MPLGVEVRNLSAPPSRGAPTATDTLFVVGTVLTGTTAEATEIRSINDFEAEYGVRAVDNAALYDYVDAFFREGGRRAFVGAHLAAGTLADGLALLTADLGPGQVAAPGSATDAVDYALLLSHAAANNRFALLDVGSDDTIAEMEALGALVPVANQSYGALFGPWLPIPAPANVIGGAERTVPGSAIVAGLIARSDALGNPNRAPAGRDFPLQYALSVPAVTDADRETALDAGVNLFADRYGVLQLYGFQTAIDQTEDSPFWQANASRARMWLTARAQEAGEHYMFKPIDAKGHLALGLKTDLDAICGELYAVDGLFGETAADAYATNVGVALNTEAAIAQGELHASVEARLSLHAKSVIIDLVSVPVTGRVSA